MSLLGKIFGDPNKKELDKLGLIVTKINSLEKHFEGFSDEHLKERVSELRKLAKQDEKKLDEFLPEIFAMVREAAKRTIGQRHFDVQLLGGMILWHGKIAEMKTGEGKTLVATLAMALNALTGRGGHLVTVNDYLAKRDCGWMGPIYHRLGISVASIVHEEAFIFDPGYEDQKSSDPRTKHLRPVTRKEAYSADVLYGTNNEFGFDYLKDNMVMDLEEMVQRELNYAIVDEVDSILIDEARTPLIISAPAEESAQMYYQFSQLVPRLEEDKDYNVDEKMKAATLTEEGMNKIEQWLGRGNIYQTDGIQSVHHLEQALKAHTLFKKDRDYVVKDGEIIIVDEFTGRLMHGRRYSEGLHQAIEAKEGVEIKKESQTLATITFQNYFRLYKKLAGMTGTAATEAEEFSKIYKLEVVIIPTHQPMIREDLSDRIYKTEEGKFKALIKEVKERHEKGQPVLIGTISIERNEVIDDLLAREGIAHEVLNAKHHEKEAMIIAQAGKEGAVTVATNMAGRGVDIILGGNPPDPDEAQKVKEAGGLHILGTERHEARRIDNQLRGRSGRQGDSGSSQFFISMEDDLMRIFGSERMKNLMDRLGVPDDMPLENKIISKSIESAQHKVEGQNFDIRKHLVEYDDVINKHREVIYKKRREILDLALKKPEILKEKILEMVEEEIEQVISFHTVSPDEKAWNLSEVYEVIETIFPVSLEQRLKLEDFRGQAGDRAQDAAARTKIIDYLMGLAKNTYEDLQKRINDEKLRHQIEKGIILRAMDILWVEHLDQIEHLRTGIGLRGYGQRDPLVEYQHEAYQMFSQLISNIQKQIVYNIYKVGVVRKIAPSPMEKERIEQAPAKTMTRGQDGLGWTEGAPKSAAPALVSRPKDKTGKKIGRNDPCPCGAKKPDGTPVKYKHCHGK